MLYFSRFDKDKKTAIMEAIQAAESGTSGEIRVHLSYDKSETDLLVAAAKKFVELKMNETKLRNGILLYVNLSVQKFAIFGDQGIHERVSQNFWDSLAREVTVAVQQRDALHGIVLAVKAAGSALKEFFPSETENPNELSDEITES